MKRETKVGMVLSASFLSLVGTVLHNRMGDPALAEKGDQNQPTQVADLANGDRSIPLVIGDPGSAGPTFAPPTGDALPPPGIFPSDIKPISLTVGDNDKKDPAPPPGAALPPLPAVTFPPPPAAPTKITVGPPAVTVTPPGKPPVTVSLPTTGTNNVTPPQGPPGLELPSFDVKLPPAPAVPSVAVKLPSPPAIPGVEVKLPAAPGAPTAGTQPKDLISMPPPPPGVAVQIPTASAEVKVPAFGPLPSAPSPPPTGNPLTRQPLEPPMVGSLEPKFTPLSQPPVPERPANPLPPVASGFDNPTTRPMNPTFTPAPVSPPPARPRGNSTVSEFIAAPEPPPAVNAPPATAPFRATPTGNSNFDTKPTPAPTALAPVGARPTGVTPPLVVGGGSTGRPAAVESWVEEDHPVQTGETFATISTRKYGTDKYAQALELFNRDHYRVKDVLRRYGLTMGVKIVIPPVYVLEKKHGAVIPGLTPTTGSAPVNFGTPAPIAAPPAPSSGFNSSPPPLRIQ